MNEKELSNTIASIYDAALRPDLWPEVMSHIAHCLGADTGVLFTPGGVPQNDALFQVNNISDNFIAEYVEHYHGIDAWGHGAIETGIYASTGSTFLGDELIDRRSLRRTEFYNDYLTRLDIESLVGAMLFTDDPRSELPATTITFHRYRRREDFDESAVTTLGLLVPHLQRAFRMSRRLSDKELQTGVEDFILDRQGCGIVMFNHAAKPVCVNGAADIILSSDCGVSLHLGRLVGRNARDTNGLSRLVSEALQGKGGEIQVPCGDRSLLHVAAMPVTEGHPLSHLASAPRVVVTLHRSTSDDSRMADAFAATCHLTPAETRVLQLLLVHLNPKEIAASLEVSIRTVRTQLSSIYAKTGTRGQSDLVHRALKKMRGEASTRF
jgi:DNA-binding CsgD family transcriptional regulator